MWKIMALLPLAGCVDFMGEFGRIGFATNARMGDNTSWKPEFGVVEGTALVVGPVALAGEKDERPVDVLPHASRGLDVAANPDGGWVVTGTRGRVEWDGEARDRFSVRFAEPVGVDVNVLGLVAHDFAIPVGARCPLQAVFREESGAPLGYSPDDLEFAIDGVFSVADGWLSAVAVGDGELNVELGEWQFAGAHVTAVPLAEVVWEVAREPFDGTQDRLRLVATVGDLPVACVALQATIGDVSFDLGPDGALVPIESEPIFGEQLE